MAAADRPPQISTAAVMAAVYKRVEAALVAEGVAWAGSAAPAALVVSAVLVEPVVLVVSAALVVSAVLVEPVVLVVSAALVVSAVLVGSVVLVVSAAV